MKDINRATVLNAIRIKGPISRVGISQLVKLSGTTISVIVDDLQKEGFIYEVGTEESTGGRKPILLELNPGAGYAIGIDLGGTDSLFGAMIDLKGQILGTWRKEVDPLSGPEPIINIIKGTVREIISESSIPYEKILGIGVGIPALVDSKKGIVHSAPNLGNWNEIPLKSIIENEFNISTHIDDSVKARAQGERWHMNGDLAQDNLLYITVSKGIGAAIIADGDVYRGADGFAGELGHMTVDLNGPLCSCGNRGCLEAMASERALVRMARERLAIEITELTESSLKAQGSKAIFEAARRGDVLAKELIEEIAGILAAGIGSVVNMLNPAVIVVSGTMVQKAWDLLAEPFIRNMSERVLRASSERLRVIRAGLEGEKTAVGPATLVLRDFFNYPVER